MAGTLPTETDSIISCLASAYYFYFILYLLHRRSCQGLRAAHVCNDMTFLCSNHLTSSNRSAGRWWGVAHVHTFTQRTDPEKHTHYSKRKWSLSGRRVLEEVAGGQAASKSAAGMLVKRRKAPCSCACRRKPCGSISPFPPSITPGTEGPVGPP